MPAPRRSTGGSRARPGPEKGQSTISFATRVTKASAPTDVKKAVLTDPAPKKAEVVQSPTEDELEHVKDDSSDEEDDSTEEEEEEVEDEQEEGEDGDVEDEVEEKLELEVGPIQTVSDPEPAVPADAEKDESDLLAERMKDAEIKEYWIGIQSARLAVPVHQEGLTVSEKVLRYFDVSSQYGVSVPFRQVAVRSWARLIFARKPCNNQLTSQLAFHRHRPDQAMEAC